MAKLHRAVLPLLVAVVAVSCSGDDDTGSGHPPTADGLAAAAKQQAQAFIDEPGATYQYLSADCRSQLTRSEWAGEMLLARGFFESFAGFELTDASIGGVEVRFVDGESGEAVVELLDPDGEPLDDQNFSVFLYEDGDWRSTDCHTFDDGGSQLEDDGWAEMSDDDVSSDTTYAGELRPAAEAVEEEARDHAQAGVVGAPIELYGGLTVVVSAIELGEAGATATVGSVEAASGDYIIDVTIRTENRSAEYLTNPEVAVTCANDVWSGSYYLDSTFESYADLPPRTFDEGVVTLGVPENCVDPVVRVSDYLYSDDEWSDDEEVAIDWPVPADLQP